MAFLRFTRDKRGYEHFYLVEASTNRRGKTRARVLYWFRTPPGIKVGREPFDEDVRRALYCSKMISYAQGYMLLREAAKEEGWNLNFGGIALMWRGGCIIRSRFLEKIKEAYNKNPQLKNLLLDDFFSKTLNDYQASWRRGIIQAIQYGVPTPAFSTALSFYDGYRTARLPANLLQAQRDYFGAHTFERVDQPRGKFFHIDWPEPGRPQVEV